MSSTSATAVRPRLTYVDGLRALAALAVFCVHATGILFVAARGHPGGPADLLLRASRYGALGVDVFFVISGFVIAYSIRDDRVTPGYAGRFALRRSLRLDPPYWCAIAVGVIWIAVRRRLGGTGGEPVPTVRQVLAHLFYLQSILGQRQVVVVFWTLCLEVQLYLAFIALLLLSRWVPRRLRFDRGNAGATATLCAFALSLAWPAGLVADALPPLVRMTGPNADAAAFMPWFPPAAFKFLAGASVAFALLGRLRPAHVAAALALLATALAVNAGRHGRSLDLLSGTVALATATSLLVAARTGGLSTWLSWRPLVFVGSISYSFYLLHVPVIGLVLAIQKRSGWTGLPTAAGFLVLAIGLTLLAAFGLYRGVERPSVRLARYLKGPTTAAGERPVAASA